MHSATQRQSSPSATWMDRARKRARVGGDADAAAAAEWTFHGEQRLVGVCGDPGVSASLSLVAAGERHVQIRAADAAASGAVGKLVALESGRWTLWRPQDGAARFYVATPSDAVVSGGVRVLDAHSVAFSYVPFPRQDDQMIAGPAGRIDGAFIDGDTGQAIVLVEQCDGENTAGHQQWRLWCWRRRGEWTTIMSPIQATAMSTSAWDARFIMSPVFGRCLQLIGVVTSPETATATLISQILTGEDDWAVIHTQQHTVSLPSGKIEDTDGFKIWLSPSLRWVLMLSQDGQHLTRHQLNPFETTPVSSYSVEIFEVAVSDVSFHGDFVAVLFLNGSLQLMELPHPPDHAFVRVDIEERGKLGNAVQFSVMEKAVNYIPTLWDRLVWLPKQHQIFASCGSKTVRISLSVDNSFLTSSPLIQETTTTSASAQKRGDYTPSNAFHRRRKRSHTRVSQAEEFGVVSTSAPSNVTDINLLHSIRLILRHHDTRVVDQVFTILGIVLQRVLKGLGLIRDEKSFKTASCDDVPIQVGIMEMLVAQVVLTKYSTIHSTASKIVQAPTFCSRQERRLYYHEEIRSVASGSSDIRMQRHVHHRNFLRFITDTLSNLVADTSFSEVARLGISTQGIARSSTILTTTNAGKVMKEIERHDLTGVRYPPWLRVEATLAVFAITSDLLDRDQLILDLPTLARLFSGFNSTLPLNVLREDYVKRFLSIGSVHQHTAEIQEDRSVQIDLIRRIAVKSGVMAHLIHHCGSDLQLLEFLYSSKRPKDKDEASNRLYQAVSLQIVCEALTQLASMFQSSPLFITSQASKRFDSTSTPSWISAAEEDVIAFESFIKLVFISTDLNAISDELVTGHIKAASPTRTFDVDEIERRRRLFRLSGVVMSHVKNLATSLRDPNPGERLSKIFRELFLFDELWSSTSTTTKFSIRDILEYVNEATLQSDGQGRRILMHGRVTGLQAISQLESSVSDRSLEYDGVCRFARTLAVVLWSFWIRERVSFCKEAIDCYRRSDRKGNVAQAEAVAARKLGHLAASCALHLKVVALQRDVTEEDEIMSSQLFFLEAATELNHEAACKVIAWAFSADAVSARHVRRFRAIQSTTGVSGVDGTDRYRDELRRAVRQMADDSESGGTFAELDAFGTSCCDASFQRLVWALLQRRFTVVSATSKPQDKAPIKKILQSRPSTVDGMISRHEVVHLLQAQRHEIEDKMQRLKNATEIHPENGARGSSAAHSSRRQKPEAEDEAYSWRSLFTTAHHDLEKYQVRDLDSRHRSHDSLTATADQRTISSRDSAMLRKGTSSQNVLKLLQLRKDAQEIKRHQSAPRMVGVSVKPLDAAPKLAPSDEKPEPSETRRVRKNREQALVAPLRHEHPPAAELILLTSSNQNRKKTVPLSRRSFQLAIAPTECHSIAAEEPPEFANSAIQCTETRPTSIQTDEIKHAPAKSTEFVQQEEPTSLPPRVEAQEKVHSVSVGVQSQDPPTRQPDGTSNSHALSISDRFPVYVDLQSAANGKFLRVAPMKRSTSQTHLQRDHTRIANEPLRNDDDATPSGLTVPTAADGTPESPSPTHEELSQAQILERRRHTYRTHFPPTKARLVRTLSDRNHSSGVDSFVTLKSEMERMKARLTELEDCARDLDDDFKVSHHNLENLGKGFGDDARAVMDAVANVVDTTEAANDIPPTTLSLKATRDLDSARHLLEQIERLTTAEQSSR